MYYAILRDNVFVQHVTFKGTTATDLYKKPSVEIVLFEDKDRAVELLTVWPDAKIIEVWPR